MDMTFSDEDLAFRDEVRAFLEEAFTGDLREKVAISPTGYLDPESQRQWQQTLYEKGWAAPRWPTEYGGTGWSPAQNYLWENEMAAAGAPRPVAFGVRMCGPVIMEFGTPEQKAHYLPRILSFEDWWCQGYSEPGSGSDLASLGTRAVRNGDEYVVNGSKIWTTLAQHADWIFCLVRTSQEERRQDGISFLLIDMKTPGIAVEPVLLIDGVPAGDHEVNQVFFEDVRVPVGNRIGEEGKGWTYAKYLLEFERGGSHSAQLKAAIAKVKKIAGAESSGGGRLIDESDFRARLAQIEIEVSGVEANELRILSALSGGKRPGPESSLLKMRGSELIQAVTEMALEAVGHGAMANDPDALTFGSNIEPIGPDYAAVVAPKYFNYRKVSIYGGTNEIQRNIIAKHILGL